MKWLIGHILIAVFATKRWIGHTLMFIFVKEHRDALRWQAAAKMQESLFNRYKKERDNFEDHYISQRVRADQLADHYQIIANRYNALVKERKQNTKQFNDDELTELLKLVHPDKHNNSPLATRVTQKVLQLRQ